MRYGPVERQELDRFAESLEDRIRSDHALAPWIMNIEVQWYTDPFRLNVRCHPRDERAPIPDGVNRALADYIDSAEREARNIFPWAFQDERARPMEMLMPRMKKAKKKKIKEFSGATVEEEFWSRK